MKCCKPLVAGSVIIVGWTLCAVLLVKLWEYQSRVGRVVDTMTTAEKERVALELDAAMFNASQTNWQILIVPRVQCTNRLYFIGQSGSFTNE